AGGEPRITQIARMAKATTGGKSSDRGSALPRCFSYPCYPCYPWLFLFLAGVIQPRQRPRISARSRRMASAFVLAVDQGTSSTRAAVFDETGRCRASVAREFRQHYPQAGWVEHDPREIWRTV